MIVRELIEQLKAFDPKMEVYFAHPSHDYWRTELATEVSAVEEEPLKHSGYHEQMTTISEDKRDELDQLFVVLR